MCRPLVPLALLLALLPCATALSAETYKWVDERGVVNYSNTPPASVKAAKPQAIEERVSTIESDEATKAAAALAHPTPYQEALEKEWLQRQKLMALANAAQPAPCTPYDCPYYQDDRLSTAYPYVIPVFRAPRIRPTRVVRTPVDPNPPSKARLLQLQR